VADLVIASLMGAWIVQKIVLSLPGFAGYVLPIVSAANTAAYVTIAALALRIVAETVATHLYPDRLAAVHPAKMPWPSKRRSVLAALFRTALFVFFARMAVTVSWQLAVGALLFLVPQVLKVYERDLPTWPPLQRVVPEKMVKTVVLLFATGLLALWVLEALKDDPHLIDNAFVLLALPGVTIAVMGAFAGEKPDPEFRWRRAAAGTGLLTLGALQAMGKLF
jgi:hypothetical protein